MSKYLATCPYCKQSFSAQTEWIGQKATCPTCQQEIVIPAPPEGAVQPDAAPPEDQRPVGGSRPVPAVGKTLWRYFIESVTVKYADRSGRASRKEVWGTLLFIIIFSFAIGIFLQLIVGNTPLRVIVNLLIGIGLFMPEFSLLMRRLHDLGKSGKVFGGFFAISCALGWLANILVLSGNGESRLLAFIGTVNIAMGISIIVVASLKGQTGSNQFGPDPLQ